MVTRIFTRWLRTLRCAGPIKVLAGRRSAGWHLLGFSLVFAGALEGCGAGVLAPVVPVNTDGTAITLSGKAMGGQQPVVNATIQLYAAGTTGDASTASPLIGVPAVLTGSAGDFNITGRYTCPNITSEVYLIASGGNPGLAPGTYNNQLVLMSALGPCGNLSSSTHIVINEASTVGSIYPITAFMNSYLTVGSSTADFNTLAADFMQINQFINTDGGQSPGPALPAGFSAPVAGLYTLANAMASCINSAGGVATDGTPCGQFLQYATPPGGTAPTNTADAILDIANNPTNNVTQLFMLASASGPFQPALSSAPPDWTLKILPNIMLATPSVLVGVGSTNTGTITLGQAAPAGGLSITFTSSNTAAVTVVSPVSIPAGATTGTFSYTGVASGSATLTASAAGYVSSSVSLSATNSLISLGAIPTVAPGQSVDLPLSLGTPAPAGGTTVNFTSANPGVATISPTSVTIAAGLKVPTANPKVTGVTVGSTVINATDTGYAPGAQTVTVSVAASLPATFSVPLGTPTNETLTISAPAPAGGITFTLSSDNTAVLTVPASVTIAAGATTASIAITGIAPGTTTVRADSSGIPEATSSVTVNGAIQLQTTTLTTGKQLQVSSYFYFAAAPPTPVAATITSSAPGVAVASISPTVQGGTTATVSAITGTGANAFYVQGVSAGSATLTISAPGYVNSTISITVDPSGFVFYGAGNFSSTTLSPDTSITILPAILDPGTAAVLGYGSITPAASVSVPVSSSSTGVGTITNSPLTFGANASSATANFHSVGAGTTNLTLGTPAGFTTPTPAGTQQITATVTAPPIGIQTSAITSGAGMEVSTYAYLSQTPLVATNVTITSSNPAVAVVSTSATAAGAGTTTVPAVVSTSAFTYYIQGISVGSTTLTISASPYTSATVNVTVDPSGFVFYGAGSFSTTSLSSATSITILPAILNPSGLTVLGYATVSPSLSPVSLPVTSSNTAVGTITSPIIFHAGDSSQTTSFQPVGAGATNISLGTPAGFSTPTPGGTQAFVVTVTAPPIGLQTTTLTTGINLEVSSYVYLSQTPGTPVTITLTSSVPSVATVSPSATVAGAASTTFPNTVSTSALTFYLQGQSVGTSVITVSAPGYQSATINVTVDPSGFIFYGAGNFSTTTFSAPSAITVLPAVLNPSTLAVLGYATLNPGISTVNLAVNSSATQVGTITSPVTFSGGSSSGTASFQPVAAGTSTISMVTPAGYSTPTPATTQAFVVTVTAPPIGLQTSAITTGTNLEVATYAYLSATPPSAVAMTVTSNDPTKVTLSTSPTALGSTSLTFSSLSSTTAQSFYLQGHTVGSTTLTLAAPGYSNATINVTVDPSGFVLYSGSFSTTTFSPATSLILLPAILTPGTLTVVGYASLSAGAGSPQVVVTSSSPSVGTVSSPVTFNAGDSSDTASFQPVGAGTTNLSIATPAGYSTPSAATTQQITATVTAPPVGVQTTALTTGSNLQISTYAYLSQTPPSAVTLTLTSSNPAVAVLSKALTTAGAASINYPGLTSTGALSYYVEGLSVGSSIITVSAPGYSSATVTVTVDPSGFVIYGAGNFSTTTFSTATSITVLPAVLNSGVLTVLGYASLNPGVSVTVPLTSSVTSVGTVSSSVTFNGGDSSQNASFQPASAGSTTISLTTPAGFTTPSQSATQQITATVTAPPIGAQTTALTTGANLQVSTYAYLGVTPPAAVTLTVTSANPAVATVSTSATVVGTSAITFGGVSGTGAMSYYVQGQAVGTTTITLSAPGFQSTVITVTVGPSGFVIYNPGNFSTTTGAPTTITINAAILNSGVLTVAGYAALNPGLGTVNVPVGSTSPQIGTVSPTTLSFNPGDISQSTVFQPIASGSTDVVIVSQPTGFTTPSQPATQQIVVTVQ